MVDKLNGVHYNEHRSAMNQARRERQRAEARRAILDVARETLVSEGHESFSMRKLADRAGYSPGTIYLYFRDKADLLEQLTEEAFSKLLENLDEVHDKDDAVESLRNKLRSYIDFGLTHPSHYRFAFVIRPDGGKRAARPVPHASFDVLREAVRRCIDEGHFSSSDCETTSQVLWTAIHGVTSLMIVLPHFPWVERKRLIDELLDTVIEGLQRATERGGHV